MPLILSSPAYKHGDTLVVITFDEADVDRSDPTYAAACCGETTGPNTHAPGNAGLATDTAPGGGQIGALLLNPKYVTAGSTDTTGSYNHYSALRSYEDLLGLTTGGTDGEGHLGFAAATGLAPFGTDVFSSPAAAKGQTAQGEGSLEVGTLTAGSPRQTRGIIRPGDSYAERLVPFHVPLVGLELVAQFVGEGLRECGGGPDVPCDGRADGTVVPHQLQLGPPQLHDLARDVLREVAQQEDARRAP